MKLVFENVCKHNIYGVSKRIYGQTYITAPY